MATPRLAGDVIREALDKADGALLLAFVLRTYGDDRARAVVSACLAFIDERDRELTQDFEPERDTLPATLFWCECSESITDDLEHPDLCARCRRLVRRAAP